MINNNNNMPKCWRKVTKPHLFCPGCGHGITLKQLGFAIDDLGIQHKTTFGIDIGCSLLAWNFFDIDTLQTHHGRTTPAMVGYKMAAPNRVVIGYMGDGGGYAIGLQSLLHAAFRNNPITTILVNNENYAMTGGQMAPTTEEMGVTTTSPNGKEVMFGSGLRGAELVRNIAPNKAYITRVSLSNPEGVRAAFKKALNNQIENNSFSFVEVLSICPTNWKTNAKDTLQRLKDMESYYKVGELTVEEKNE
ncbi:MAG: Pyruvate synthase subunit PorB [bacterium ADurb.Bin212]|nr:MAG: Pyruvate synthase subunit PorB [bacterium ADurb.Bin212]